MEYARLKGNTYNVGVLDLGQYTKKVLDHFTKIFFFCRSLGV